MQGPENAYAADAQDDFLLQTHFTITAVKPGSELTVRGAVFFQMGIQQIKPGFADIDLPDGHINRPGIQVDFDF